MGFLDFIDTTFILTLGIVLLICGGIMIYCYRRLNVLENGLIQQGRVMQEFITNYNMNNHILMQKQQGDLVDSNNYSNLENSLESSNVKDTSSKIIVSDDEDYDSDSDSDENDNHENLGNIENKPDEVDDNDNDSDSDSDNDSEEDEEDDDVLGLKVNILSELNKDQDENNHDHENDNKKELHIEDLVENLDKNKSDALSDELLVSKLEEIDNIKDLDLTKDLETIDVSNVDSSKLIPITDTEGIDITKKNPNKLKVDELRELVVNKNLITNEEAQKLNKNKLLKLLE